MVINRLFRKHREAERGRETIERQDRDDIEAVKMARLESAEAEVADLVARSKRAVSYLDARGQRNHWRESIEQMIQGA